MYEPKPIKTDHINLPDFVIALVMLLAASVHDTWAIGKIEKGYKYGEVTSDAEKTHCDLKPFPELNEGTQSYDVNTVLATVKGLYALGYEIKKRETHDDIPYDRDFIEEHKALDEREKELGTYRPKTLYR